MSSVKMILVLARKWRVPAKHGDVPNAYVQTDKETELGFFLRAPQGMKIPAEILERSGVTSEDELVLELKKALYGLKRRDEVLVVVGVYVNDLLVTDTEQEVVDACFGELASLSVKGLGRAHKFLGIHVTYDEDEGYHLDQEMTIADLLKEHGMEFAHSVRAPIGEECPRPDIGFAVHKAPRRTHSPTVSDWKLGKRIVGYLAGTKRLRLRMRGDRERGEPIKVTAFSDADSAADTEARKSVTGGFVTVDGMAVCWFCEKQE
ncbi:hypothetical protein PC117_g9023 [Phytophthora cactorum]|uniref:Reverse transcriptase Ty1/copia-type domain-containing protein n=2 Tax=Phytophthora cactorum TaxID=29920 RepID=A0A8T1DTJ2_9STRA|nr:hypothetical protein PC117_g9023 [Phytophthora cactorum]